MNTQNDRYSSRGVSHQKEDIHKAINKVNKTSVKKNSPFDNAFCKAIPNPFPHSKKEDVFLLHADGSGTKSALAYLYWKETNDISVFKGIAQDALVMNTDDMLCVGAVDNFMFSSTIGRNKHLIPGEIISALIEGNEEFVSFLNDHDIQAQIVGGETADIGDLVQTVVVDATATTFLEKNKFIQTQQIKPNSVIIGLASFGKATYEKEYNSGIGSNGLTSARHDLLKSIYKKYPETFSEITEKSNPELIYGGAYSLLDSLPYTDESINIGKALLSPTRTYLPIIKKVLSESPQSIDAIIHCTGGAQTKCLKFGNNIHYVKNNLFELPALFKILKEQTSYEEFFQVFNGGHRLEIYTDEKTADIIIDISKSFNVNAQIIGYTEHSEKPNNELTISYNANKENWHHNYSY